MFDWNETNNGNHVREDDDLTKITVFIDKNGAWRGIRDERITERGYTSAEEAMEAIDTKAVEFVKFRPSPTTTDWKLAKKGSHYRYKNGDLLTSKQASSGQWYVTINGKFLPNKWFPTFEAASRYADSLVP